MINHDFQHKFSSVTNVYSNTPYQDLVCGKTDVNDAKQHWFLRVS